MKNKNRSLKNLFSAKLRDNLASNLPLVVGIALPVVFIMVLAVIASSAPSFIKPEHDFIYSTGNASDYISDASNLNSDESNGYGNNYDSQDYQNFYEVEDGHIKLTKVQSNDTKEKIPNPELSPTPINKPNLTQVPESASLYLYDVDSDTSRLLTLEEAQKYNLNPGPYSADGYTVSYLYSNDAVFGLFGSKNEQGYFISKGKWQKKINVTTGDDYWGYGNFQIIGWLK